MCTNRDKFVFHSDSEPYNARSHTGAMLVVNNVPVAWLSKRQPVTAVSPAEAEIHALRDAVLAARLTQWVEEEMGIVTSWPVLVGTDSSQALSFQRDACPNSKIRGCFQLRDSWVRDLRNKKEVKIQKIPRNLNMADLMTHCLSNCKFQDGLSRALNFEQYNCRGACVYNPLFTCTISTVVL